MQVVSSDFTRRTSADLRIISSKVLISFEKNFDPDVDFFTIGDSSIGGTDILKGIGSIIQEWDKYVYNDYSDRILSIDIDRRTEPPTNLITLANATVVLDNTDDLFTPGNSDSELDGYLLPRRPIRINLGFSGETVPKFIGLIDGKPQINDRNKTATFHCIDFLSAILNISLDEDVMYQDYRTDEYISELLQTAGLTTSQFSLDVGTVTIPFLYAPKGYKIGDGIRGACQAELGNFSMLEDGTTLFRNRSNWSNNETVWDFTDDDVIERETASADTIINDVEVNSNPREVKTNQPIFTSSGPIELPPNTLTSLFFTFKDDKGRDLPVTGADEPEYYSTATTSYYKTNTEYDGSGSAYNSYISLDSSSLFSTGIKLIFDNSHPTQLIYLTELEIFGTPAKILQPIYIHETDSSSIGSFDAYEERTHKIDSDFIQDEQTAISLAKILIADRSSDDDVINITVRAVPQLQIGDKCTYNGPNTDEQTYYVTRINDIIDRRGYRQILEAVKRSPQEYYAIGINSIGGTAALAP